MHRLIPALLTTLIFVFSPSASAQDGGLRVDLPIENVEQFKNQYRYQSEASQWNTLKTIAAKLTVPNPNPNAPTELNYDLPIDHVKNIVQLGQALTEASKSVEADTPVEGRYRTRESVKIVTLSLMILVTHPNSNIEDFRESFEKLHWRFENQMDDGLRYMVLQQFQKRARQNPSRELLEAFIDASGIFKESIRKIQKSEVDIASEVSRDAILKAKTWAWGIEYIWREAGYVGSAAADMILQTPDLTPKEMVRYFSFIGDDNTRKRVVESWIKTIKSLPVQVESLSVMDRLSEVLDGAKEDCLKEIETWQNVGTQDYPRYELHPTRKCDLWISNIAQNGKDQISQALFTSYDDLMTLDQRVKYFSQLLNDVWANDIIQKYTDKAIDLADDDAILLELNGFFRRVLTSGVQRPSWTIKNLRHGLEVASAELLKKDFPTEEEMFGYLKDIESMWTRMGVIRYWTYRAQKSRNIEQLMKAGTFLAAAEKECLARERLPEDKQATQLASTGKRIAVAAISRLHPIYEGTYRVETCQPANGETFESCSQWSKGSPILTVMDTHNPEDGVLVNILSSDSGVTATHSFSQIDVSPTTYGFELHTVSNASGIRSEILLEIEKETRSLRKGIVVSSMGTYYVRGAQKASIDEFYRTLDMNTVMEHDGSVDAVVPWKRLQMEGETDDDFFLTLRARETRGPGTPATKVSEIQGDLSIKKFPSSITPFRYGQYQPENGLVILVARSEESQNGRIKLILKISSQPGNTVEGLLFNSLSGAIRPVSFEVLR